MDSLNKRQYEIIPTHDEADSLLKDRLPIAQAYKKTYSEVEPQAHKDEYNSFVNGTDECTR